MWRKAPVELFTCAALAGLALVPLAPVPAGAASSWSSPIDVSAASDDPSFPQVALNAQGDAVAVWNGEIGLNVVVQAAVRMAGGTWQAPIDISAPSTLDQDPRVAVDAQGNAVAVWRRYNANEYIVQSAARPENGRWRAPVNLSAAGHSAGGAQVAVDPQGNAVAIWQRFKSRNVIAVQSAVRPVGGSWQAPVELSASDQDSSTHPQVAVAANGDAVAVWKNDGVSSFIVKAAARPAGGGWQAPVDISAAGPHAPRTVLGQVFPTVAVDARGDAVAVWDYPPTATTSIVQGAVRTAGTWQPPVNLSAAGQNADAADVAVDPRGNAVAVWGRLVRTTPIGTTSVVQGAVRAAGETWQAPVNISTTSQSAVSPHVAVDPQNNAVAIWSAEQAGTQADSSIVQSAARAAGGTWQAPVDIATAGSPGVDSADVAVDAQGNAVAVWDRYTGRPRYLVEGDGGSIAQTADYAATKPPPVVPSLARMRLSPSTFRAGQTVTAVRPRATQVSYTLNVAASVRFTVQRLGSGRKVAGRCVKPTNNNRRRTRCVRFVRLRGSFTRRRPAGPDRFAFNGDISNRGRLLTPARYRLLATPIAKSRTGAAAYAAFRIVR